MEPTTSFEKNHNQRIGERFEIPPMLISVVSNYQYNHQNKSLGDGSTSFKAYMVLGDVTELVKRAGTYFLKIDDGTGTIEARARTTNDAAKNDYLQKAKSYNLNYYYGGLFKDLVGKVCEQITNTCPIITRLRLGDCILAMISVENVEGQIIANAFKVHRMEKQNAMEIKYDWYFGCLNYYRKKKSMQ